MSTEIEAKLKVESHEPVTAALRQLGAEFAGVLEQADYYFDDDARSMTRADKCLRIRRQRSGENTRLFITYKGPKAPQQYKQRQEVEFEVSDRQAAAEFFEAMGYHEALVVRKTRGLWHLGNCEVALDDLEGLGLFVEIEGGSSTAIEKVQNLLGLAEKTHIPQSYADLLQRASDPGRKD